MNKSYLTTENDNSVISINLPHNKSHSNLTPIKSSTDHTPHFQNKENVIFPNNTITPEEYQKRINDLEQQLHSILHKIHNSKAAHSIPFQAQTQADLHNQQLPNPLKTLNEDLNRKLIEYKHNILSKEKTIKSQSDIIAKLKENIREIKKDQRQFEDIVLQQEAKIKGLNETMNVLFKDLKRKTVAIKDSKNYIAILEQSLKEFKGDEKNLDDGQKKDIVHHAEMMILKEQIDKYAKENEAQTNRIKILEEHNMQLRSKSKTRDKLICKSMSYAGSYSKENRHNSYNNDNSTGNISNNNTNNTHIITTAIPSKSSKTRKIILSYTDSLKSQLLNKGNDTNQPQSKANHNQ